jgi:hypothetical protein
VQGQKALLILKERTMLNLSSAHQWSWLSPSSQTETEFKKKGRKFEEFLLSAAL